jgi:Protein of unknown function (DUF3108)
MPVRHPIPRLLLPSGRKPGFMLLVLAASVLAHLFIIQWARDSFVLALSPDDEQDVIQLSLPTMTTTKNQRAIPEQPLPPVVAWETASPRLPDAPDTSTVTAANENAIQTNTTPELATAPDPTTRAVDALNETASGAVVAPPPEPVLPPEPSPVQAHAPPESSPPQTHAPLEPNPEQAHVAPEQASPPTNVPAGTASTTTDAPRLLSRVSLPPSADLSYDAVAIKGSSKVEGRGLVKWVQNGRQYSITGEASVLFLSVLSYRSEGHLGEVGILPELYTEKRVGKSSTNTHFHRERQTISFSASTNSYSVKGGEQDRGSVFWQLAGLARGNPDKLQAGLSFELIIAGSRTADTWRVTVHGTETIAIGQGRTDAWHMSLVRTDGSTDYQLEVWIAPGQDWYPVKIMYVDRKGTSLGLTLSKLEKK